MRRDWYELAAQAKTVIGRANTPGIMSRREAAAESVGLARQTLRNYIAAHDFVERVSQSDPELAGILRRMPSLAAEIYNRWWAKNEDQASAHVRIAIRDGLSVREIMAAYKNSAEPEREPREIVDELVASWRGSKPSGRIRPDIEFTFRRQHFHAPALNQLYPEACDHSLARSIGVEVVLVPSGGLRPSGAIALLRINGSALSDGMRRQWRTVLAKALAASHFYPLVVVLAPNGRDLEQLVESIPFDHDAREDNLGPSIEKDLARALARCAAPRVLRPGNHAGGVLFSSVNSFVSDYYAG